MFMVKWCQEDNEKVFLSSHQGIWGPALSGLPSLLTLSPPGPSPTFLSSHKFPAPFWKSDGRTLLIIKGVPISTLMKCAHKSISLLFILLACSLVECSLIFWVFLYFAKVFSSRWKRNWGKADEILAWPHNSCQLSHSSGWVEVTWPLCIKQWKPSSALLSPAEGKQSPNMGPTGQLVHTARPTQPIAGTISQGSQKLPGLEGKSGSFSKKAPTCYGQPPC